jgi:hypothetical protein
MDSSDDSSNEDDLIDDKWSARCIICKIYLLDYEMFYDLEEDDVKCEWCWFSERKHGV